MFSGEETVTREEEIKLFYLDSTTLFPWQEPALCTWPYPWRKCSTLVNPASRLAGMQEEICNLCHRPKQTIRSLPTADW